ncbi:MAG: LysM peptidoglycan-binding domain-containing protein [Lachnospiraceae bacterium]|nr:LysM peptidoglycan-binding domain-containing protein [Lachnospiraceae bacterium]
MERVVKKFYSNIKLFMVSLCVLLTLGVCFFSSFNDTGKVSASTSNQKYFICIDIKEGDSLWSIADLYISEEYSSVEEYVKEVKELNGLTSDKIFCGATLVVPYYAP